MRRVLGAAFAVSGLVALAGCQASGPSGPSDQACPAIGFVEGVRIRVVPSAPGAPDLQGCVGEVCSPVVNAPLQSAGAGPDQPGPVRLRAADPTGTDWMLEVDTRPLPARIGVRLLRDGHLEQTDRFALHWHRADPSSRCDLHSTTAPVRIVER